MKELFERVTCPTHAQAKLADRFLEPNIKVSKITIIDPTPEKCHEGMFTSHLTPPSFRVVDGWNKHDKLRSSRSDTQKLK